MNKISRILMISLTSLSLFAGFMDNIVSRLTPKSYANSQLLSAAKNGDIEKVVKALKAGANVNYGYKGGDPEFQHTRPYWNGETALIIASHKGYLDIVRLLLKHGANVNQSDDCGGNALRGAISSGAIDVIKLLIQSGANVNDIVGDSTALTEASKGYSIVSEPWRLELVKLLLQSGANPRLGAMDIIPGGQPELDKLLEDAIRLQYQIEHEIKRLISGSPILQRINKLPTNSYEFQMILNYLLYEIKEKHNLEEISNIRAMLITIANRLAKIYASYVDKVIKDVLSKRLEKVLELPFDVQIEILKDRDLQEMLVDSLKLRLKRKFPLTNFGVQIPLKDGTNVSFGFLILREVAAMLPLAD